MELKGTGKCRTGSFRIQNNNRTDLSYEECLTSMELFNYANGSLGFLKCSFTTKNGSCKNC